MSARTGNCRWPGCSLMPVSSMSQRMLLRHQEFDRYFGSSRGSASLSSWLTCLYDLWFIDLVRHSELLLPSGDRTPPATGTEVSARVPSVRFCPPGGALSTNDISPNTSPDLKRATSRVPSAAVRTENAPSITRNTESSGKPSSLRLLPARISRRFPAAISQSMSESLRIPRKYSALRKCPCLSPAANRCCNTGYNRTHLIPECVGRAGDERTGGSGAAPLSTRH
jgi:hypothetical protein